VYNMQKIH